MLGDSCMLGEKPRSGVDSGARAVAGAHVRVIVVSTNAAGVGHRTDSDAGLMDGSDCPIRLQQRCSLASTALQLVAHGRGG